MKKFYPRSFGFTLLEVLIALAIIAIALIAASRAGLMMTDSELQIERRTLAHWVAENRLAEHTARRDGLEIGTQNGNAKMGGLEFLWKETTSGSANDQFRRMEVVVTLPDQPDYVLARLVGYLGKP